MKIDTRFLTAEGSEIFTGNELLLKGALETTGGVHFLGGYPGSPVADYFNSMAYIKDLLKDKGIRATINNNEALSAAALNGSQLVGCRGMIVMKSVGVHVAADALALGNLAGAHPQGGAVVVCGDDPWSDSTQVPADSRYLLRHLHMPVIEPADPQESKDYIDLSFRLSAAAELYSGYILATNLADGGGTVQCRPNQYPTLNTRQQIELDTRVIDTDKFVLLPPKTWWQEESLPERRERAIQASRQLGLNRIEYLDGGDRPVGFITSGLAYSYLLHALHEMGVLGDYPVLKYGLTDPIDPEMLRQLARRCKRLVVIEERRGFLEDQVARVIQSDRQAGREEGNAEVWGKQFPARLKGIPETRGLHPSILIERLAPLLKYAEGRPASVPVAGHRDNLDRELHRIDATERTELPALPVRLPTFCAGCPHRDTATLCLDIKKAFRNERYMHGQHGRQPVDLLFHGDTGCYTMLMYPPNSDLMHDYSGMGLGGGTGSGTDPFITNKQVVFMGDSTFFHSGQLAISQAIKLHQDITFIILDNSTTAMTGHQPTPGVDYDILGDPTAVQDIESAVTGLASGNEVPILRVDPEQKASYRKLLERTFLADGTKVIIATKECGITKGRRQRKSERGIVREKGYLPAKKHMNINSEACRFCLACAENTGCPGLRHVETDYGRKMDTDITVCVNDGACRRVRACDAFEQVTVKRKRPPRSRVPELGLDEIPEPDKRPAGDTWQACLVGVGGMGIGLTTRILVRAGHKEGQRVLFTDKKGLAIRNGGTVSQVIYDIAGQPLSGQIPFGKADLLIGVDVLEAARAMHPAGRTRVASADRTAAVINTSKVQTIAGLAGKEDFDPAELTELIRHYTRNDDFLARDISRICEKYLGSRQFANIMMLGFAFQKGLIPVSMHSIAWAIKDTLRTDVKRNLYAFNMGRKLVVQPDLFQGPPVRRGWRATLEDKARWTIRRYLRGQRLADQLRELAGETVAATEELGEEMHRQLVVRLYDCMRWGGIAYARRYAEAVRKVYDRDNADHGYAATRAVLFNLANAMLIKDAFFLAELSSSPEKAARDREKYDINPANGDRMAYRHYWHPRLKLGGRQMVFDLRLPHSALHLVKRSRWLRKVLPAWNRRENQYLADFEKRIAAFQWNTSAEYRTQLGRLSSPRCLNCSNPACAESGCPLAGDIPAWLALHYQHRNRDAYAKLEASNNFPEITSRICPALCQQACKQGISGDEVRVQDIERDLADRAFHEGWVQPKAPDTRTGRKVAIVGSGPAGLAAAQQLNRMGHQVAVLEKDPAPGGLLRYGIPAHRLEKALIDRRVEQLAAEGVEFRCGTRVGEDIRGEQLRDQFDAVLLATGAQRPRDIPAEGRDSPGVHFALDYLREANERAARARSSAEDNAAPGQRIDVAGKVVAVIGGGLTGEDCVETALAQGAQTVHQLEIMPRSQDDRDAQMADHYPDEVVRRWCIATKGFSGNGQGLRELRAVRVQWVNSAKGPVMKELPETEFALPAEVAILALGFEPEVGEALAEQLGCQVTPKGRLMLNDQQTTADGVFAAGDLASGAAYVVNAIASGRRVAGKIDNYLARADARRQAAEPVIGAE